MTEPKTPTLFVLLRAFVYALAGFGFGLHGVLVAIVDRDLPRATFFLVVGLNFDVSYFHLAYQYNLRFRRPEAPNDP